LGLVERAKIEFTKLLELNPDDPQFWLACGRILGQRGRWQETALAMDRVIALSPSDHWAWYVSAPLRLELGDKEGYRQLCREMLKRFGKTKDSTIAERTAKATLLLPTSSKDLDLAAGLAEVGLLPDGPGPFAALAKGLAEYRQGNYSAAEKRVSKIT